MRNHKLRNTNVIFFCIKCKESSVASRAYAEFYKGKNKEKKFHETEPRTGNRKNCLQTWNNVRLSCDRSCV